MQKVMINLFFSIAIAAAFIAADVNLFTVVISVYALSAVYKLFI